MEKLKIFVINLSKDIARAQYMTKQLNELGLNFEIFPAIDGNQYDFSSIYDAKICISNNGYELTNPEKGCALSHLSIYKIIEKEKIDYTLILEDDIQLDKNFKFILENIINNHKNRIEDWEYLAFNYPSTGLKYIKLWILLFKILYKSQKNRVKINLLLPIYFLKFIAVVFIALYAKLREVYVKKFHKLGKIYKCVRSTYLAGCYLLTYSGAKKLLTLSNDNLLYPADKIQNIARKKIGLKHYLYIPLMAIQRRDKFTSRIADEKIFLKIDY